MHRKYAGINHGERMRHVRTHILRKRNSDVQFTVTKGITAMNPAAALRKGSVNIDVSSLALFCASEPDVCGSMENVIRVMVTAYMPADSEKVNIYMNGAEKLRPDFCGDRNR